MRLSEVTFNSGVVVFPKHILYPSNSECWFSNTTRYKNVTACSIPGIYLLSYVPPKTTTLNWRILRVKGRKMCWKRRPLEKLLNGDVCQYIFQRSAAVEIVTRKGWGPQTNIGPYFKIYFLPRKLSVMYSDVSIFGYWASYILPFGDRPSISREKHWNEKQKLRVIVGSWLHWSWSPGFFSTFQSMVFRLEGVLHFPRKDCIP